jgi:hypothetical protein
MTRSDHDHRRLAHHAATGGHHPHHDRYHAVRRVGRRQWSKLRRGVVRLARRPVVRRMFWGATVAFAFVVVVVAAVWWRLSSGPIELDAATPWLKSAIEKNFGDKQTVTVGGTQIERDENGRTSLRLRDIVVRDSDGTVVASAPKAEVGISGLGLLSGNVRAESLNLVGAEMSVRIEMDGRVTVFAGGDKRPIAIASPTLQSPSARSAGTQTQVGTVQAGIQDIGGILTWIDSLGATGLDGHDLRELGLKDGNLIVDDQRNGKRWTFSRIDVSLTRPKAGGIAFRLASETPERPWVLSAAMRPLGGGVRSVGVEARKVSANDILLAMRLKDVAIDSDVPLSASVRAEIAGDGTLQRLQGQVIADEGIVVEHDSGKTYKLDSADIRFNWDAAQRALVVPFQIQSAGNQFTLRATLQVSPDQEGLWLLNLTRGDPVIDPIILPGGKADEDGLALNRVAVRARIDTVNRRIDVDQGDFGRIDTRSAFNVAVAVTGSLDYSDAEPHLAFGVAGTRMAVSVMKRMWPVFAADQVREWVAEHISGGTVERVVIAGNAPLPNFKEGGPALSEDELSVDIETSGTTVRPLPNLPAIRDADLTAHITGRVATVSLGRGTVEVTPGRKLNIASGIFTVPDTQVKPSSARVTFRIDGTTPAVAALLATDALRDNVGIVLDPATIRGTVAAQATIDMLIGRKVPKNSWTYTIAADLTNFAADKVLMGQKIEASSLRTTATSEGYQITGDVKINGTPATMDLSRKKSDAYALLHLQAMLDEAARRRLGIDVGSAVTGAIPVKVAVFVSNDGKDAPMNVDADLTPVTIDNLLPGWVKAAGKPAHATYTLLKGGPNVRFDDLSISGSGTNMNGSLELDGSGDIVAANFPVFAISEGDKVSLKADRGSDGVLRVVMHGDIFDGTNFVKSSLASAAEKSKHNPTDLDLDIKIGTVIGNNGETLRGLDLKLTRRADRIRTFAMTSKIGRDTPLNGDMRLRASDNHQVMFLETDDAGALFRFTNMYSRVFGGQMWVAMDPPTSDRTAQLGILSIRNFTVRDEPGLERVIAGGPGQTPEMVPFTDLHCEFTRAPGRVAVRDGVVRGPVVGVTIEGLIDYLKDDIHLRGTFVPFYGLNNMFGQIPIVGLILGGGSNEGLVGITYEASGSPSAPRISVNPVTAITPGLLRKFIPSPGSFDSNYVPPSRSEVR